MHHRKPFFLTSLTVLNDELYGTTENGSLGRDGTVFSLTPAGDFHVLYRFRGRLGANNMVTSPTVSSRSTACSMALPNTGARPAMEQSSALRPQERNTSSIVFKMAIKVLVTERFPTAL